MSRNRSGSDQILNRSGVPNWVSLGGLELVYFGTQDGPGLDPWPRPLKGVSGRVWGADWGAKWGAERGPKGYQLGCQFASCCVSGLDLLDFTCVEMCLET